MASIVSFFVGKTINYSLGKQYFRTIMLCTKREIKVCRGPYILLIKTRKFTRLQKR